MLAENTIQKILHGHVDLYQVVVEEYQQQIFSYIYRMVQNYQDAEDLTQDTFMRAYKKLSSLKDHSAFKSWLYRIAYRITSNHFKREAINLFNNPLQIEEVAYELDFLSEDYGERAAEIFGALNYKENALLTLRVIEEMSYREISLIMGPSPAVLRKRYERLIHKLQKKFLDKEAHSG